MGIDIYLNGYDEYNKRCAVPKHAFDRAVAKRDKLPRGSQEAAAAQLQVEAAADKMWSGKMGYIRSSYNGSGLFRVLEEIYGFDVGAYLFPGSWDGDGQDIDGAEFVGKVKALQQTAIAAVSTNTLKLPWIEVFTKVTGQRAPDVNAQHVRGEQFGDMVFGMLSKIVPDVDSLEGGPKETRGELHANHRWYLTEGLKDLREFGELAESINAKGERTFAYISY